MNVTNTQMMNRVDAELGKLNRNSSQHEISEHFKNAAVAVIAYTESNNLSDEDLATAELLTKTLKDCAEHPEKIHLENKPTAGYNALSDAAMTHGEDDLQYLQPFEGLPVSSLNETIGMYEVRDLAKSAIINPLLHSQLHHKLYLDDTNNNVILYGPPGCGKTNIIRWIVTALNEVLRKSGLYIPAYSLSISALIDSLLGQSEKNADAVFDEIAGLIQEYKHLLVIVDEGDALVQKRDSQTHPAVKRLVSRILVHIQEPRFASVMFIFATNHIEDFDNAILRPGRVNKTIYVGLPCEEERYLCLKKKLSKVPTSGIDDQFLRDIAHEKEGFSFADLAAIVNDAAVNTEKRYARLIEAGKAGEDVDAIITREDLENAQRNRKSSVDPQDLARCLAYKASH